MAEERTVEEFAGPSAFRAWLSANQATSGGIWMKIAKKGAPVVTATYEEALDLALAYGWIDGQKLPMDATFWLQGFSRRGARSPWSKRNREKAQVLIDAGLMEPGGLAEVQKAKADGRWDGAYDGQRDSQEPPDLAEALAANPAAMRSFAALDKTNRYAILYRIQAAKRPETRAARIEKFAAMLARGEKLHP